MAQTMKPGVIAMRDGHPVQLLSRGNQTAPALAKMGGPTGVSAQNTPALQPSVAAVSGMAAAPPPSALTLASYQPQLAVAAGAAALTAAGAGAHGTAQAEACDKTLANTKEKTPMCLINELARFNKIQHQYTLTDEQGPAHRKTFFVKLKLGEEQYAASGASIKKAQHAAAQEALEKTGFKHPPPKLTPPGKAVHGNPSITPTVELNALAMKRGEPAVYRPIEPNRPSYYPPPNFDFRGMYSQRYHHPRYPRLFYVSLKVGQREFIGEGQTRQAARHHAAEKAIKVLKTLPLPGQGFKTTTLSSDEDEASDEEEEGQDENSAPSESKDKVDGATNGDEEDGLKSEISLVYEIALRRSFPVNFEVIKESGPPHMRTFVTRCTCGEFVSDGIGNSKKLSKKRCAEKMLEELKKLPALPQQASKVRKMPPQKKKNRNLIKLQQTSVNYGVGINPISRLIQIQQAKKEKEPVYTLVDDRGLPRRREFVIQVTVGDQSCTGVGPNKKLAKRTAAEQMLQLLGYSRPSPQPQKPAIKSADSSNAASTSSSDKKVTFLDPDSTNVPNIMARQIVPGVLVLPDGTLKQSFQSSPGAYASDGTVINNFGSEQATPHSFSPQTTAAIAKELLDKGVSPTAEALKKTSDSNPASLTQSFLHPKSQLDYLARVLGFQVDFSYFFKGMQGSNQECLSLVSLSTDPPRVFHGSGPSVEASHNMAALNALRQLAETDLDNVQPAANPSVNGATERPPVVGETEKPAKSQLEVKVKTEPM